MLFNSYCATLDCLVCPDRLRLVLFACFELVRALAPHAGSIRCFIGGNAGFGVRGLDWAEIAPGPLGCSRIGRDCRLFAG